MKKLTSLTLLFIFLLSACAAPEPEPTVEPTPAGPSTLTIMTHDSFAASEEVIALFEKRNQVNVEILLAGDAGSAVNKAALSKGVPLADVFYGVDNTFLSRALEEEIFEAYDAPGLAEIPASFKLDPENRALPVNYGDVCLNYDIAWFASNGIAPPATLEDLLLPEYKGLLTVENPATSSPGLAFLFATIGHFGADGYLEFWDGLVANDVHVVNDWETAYYAEFTMWGGTDPLVVSYGSSPPFEVLFAEEPLDSAPTAAVIGDGACFRQIEFVGILAGTQNRALAEKWVDFMLSVTFQEDIPLNMYVFPTNQNAVLDQTFVDYLAVPENPATLDPAEIANNRESWIEAWTEAVLR